MVRSCGLSLVLAALSFAGSTVIEVRAEGSGPIVKVDGDTNPNGAMVWNGTEWVVNTTWAHKYFADVRDGSRLHAAAVQAIPPGIADDTPIAYEGATVQRTEYSYRKTSASGVWNFRARQYWVAVPGASEFILRSRGTGAGAAPAYFDIYIGNDRGVTVTALRGDPAWFTYTMSLDQALLQTSASANRTGDFPSTTGWYFLDSGGGADLGPAGVGTSYIFHTAALAVADPALGLGSSFAVDFSYRWMDYLGNVKELQFVPSAEGTFTPNGGTPPPVPAPPTLLLLLAGALGLAARKLWRLRM